MRRLAVIAAVGLAATSLASPAPSAGARVLPARPHLGAKRTADVAGAVWADGKLLVRWRRGVADAPASELVSDAGARVVDRVSFPRVDVVETRASVPEAVARFARSPLVAWAQPDYLLFPARQPSDPLFGVQWNLRNTGQLHPVTNSAQEAQGEIDADIDADTAWGSDTLRPVIAVLDSGVDVTHADLDGNLWTNPKDPEDGRDNDGNGRVDDVNGWDFARDSADLFQDQPDIVGYEHGTHVAGIAAAETDNATGIAGVCPSCLIMVLKFMKPTDTNGDGVPDAMAGRTSAELEALAYARRHGADVVNASFGSPAWSRLERRAFVRLGKSGTLSVVSAGNENGDNDMFLFGDLDGDGLPEATPSYPASYDLDTIVSVAASNHEDQYGYGTACARRLGRRAPCTFTNWGRVSVDLAAPGVDVLSTIAFDRYDVFDGTSMAAPHVAGVAGLVKGKHRRWAPREVKNAILSSVDRPASLDDLYAVPGHRVRSGGVTLTDGRVNADKARQVAVPKGGSVRSDGTIRGATKLRKLRRGKLGWPRDVNDVYRKRLERGRRYRAVLRGPRGEDFDLIIYKPGTKEIWQVEAGCPLEPSCKVLFYRPTESSDEASRFRATTTGKYFFQVSSFFSKGRYRLRVVRI